MDRTQYRSNHWQRVLAGFSAFFFWKQVFQAWRNKNKANCSTLTKSIKIVWTDNTAPTPQVQQNEKITDTVIHTDEQVITEIVQSDLGTLAEGPDDRRDDELSRKLFEESEEESLPPTPSLSF
eukprot:235784_1